MRAPLSRHPLPFSGAVSLPGRTARHARRLRGAAAARQGAGVATLLIVHHTPSPNCQALFEAAVAGATAPEIEGVRVVRRAALSATASDVLQADGYLLGTPANLGYMSGALKHFFDQVYYPCLDETRGRPFGYYVHGGNDVTGAVRAIEAVTTGLGWRRAADAVTVTGEPGKGDTEACWELGATIAAGLMPGD
ncbi:NAD(P)H-dependent oxidoreductase [Streptomyces sp. NPDC007189]|uniref:flavodoxin family protein n=1 Tax=Streptomyces sp. NPDC007189 TaxID=3154315 RepID=UPI0034553F44